MQHNSIVKMLFVHAMLLIAGTLFAQERSLCNKLPNGLSCNLDLTVPLLDDDQVAVERSVQYTRSGNFPDISYANTNPLYDDCGTGSMVSCNVVQPLVYDVFYPDNIKTYPCYESKPLPAVILFHGGGFSDCSDYTGEQGIEFYCREFAKRGFVAFNVEYRRGRIRDTQYLPDNTGAYFSASNLLATYRAIQDGRGAVRSIIDRNNTSSMSPYKIDTNRIYVGGVSSGSIIAMGIAYYTPEMLTELFGNVTALLGPPDNNMYTGSAGTGYRIRGVLNLWGGLYMPPSYTGSPADFFRKNKDQNGSRNPPMIAFQGNQDNVVPVQRANIFYSVSKNFRVAGTCTPTGTVAYTVPDNDDADGPVVDLVMYGAKGYYDILKGKMGVPSELYLDNDMRHGLDRRSNFGTAIDIGPKGTGVIPYLVQRAAVFFQAVENNIAPVLEDTKFIECENYRKGCSYKNDHAQCSFESASIATMETASQLKSAPTTAIAIRQQYKTLYVQFNAAVESQVIVYDLYGKPVKMVRTTSASQAIISCDMLPAGIYVVKVISGKSIESRKISLL